LRPSTKIDSLVASISREEFANDRVRRLAVERLLEILSEASRHVPKTLQEASDIPWRDIADLGNLLRHAYHRVDADVVGTSPRMTCQSCGRRSNG
jgi:uncharacterized protein with HEPN domain